VVYGAWWFEFILLLLAINLSGAILYFKLYKRNKISRGIFHFSFLLILAGAFFTKHFAIEGNMMIREGECSNQFIGEVSAFSFACFSGENQIAREYYPPQSGSPKLLDEMVIPGSSSSLLSVSWFPVSNVPVLHATENGKPVIALVFVAGINSYALGMTENQHYRIENIPIGFNTPESTDLRFLYHHDSLFVIAPDTLYISYMMSSSPPETFPPETKIPAGLYSVYETTSYRFVITAINPSGIVSYEQKPTDSPVNQILVEIKDEKESYFLPISPTLAPDLKNTVSWENGSLTAAWHPKSNNLPFTVCLNDFILERYPGSKSPSSYRSRVTLNDSGKNVSFPFDIYMNNILKYKGYRFYQSSYDNDEKGTILSVRKDTTGTTLTYLGYFMMILSMVWAMVDRNSRFRSFLKKMQNPVLVLLISTFSLLVFASNPLVAQQADKSTAEKFGRLQVLGANERMMPVNTLADEV
ncbi:MAG: hypothetical protein EOL88_14805, partial [Bacteroidia bacterium]|nr:hypothetical protein [Bacteroidia bacterium]